MIIITADAFLKFFEKQELIDIISEAIQDSMDMDWNSTIGAKSVMEALIKEKIFLEQ